ncbi:MAG TPA: hypothetical protein VKM93_04630 [Terriglobia bacterium]|nr:hypothetical protein [Terriglobia bacterium]
MSDKRQKNQLVLAFREGRRSEAPTASGEGTESLAAKRLSESPAIGERLIEEVCERENCKQALAPDPYVRWCDRERWRQLTYVDFGVRQLAAAFLAAACCGAFHVQLQNRHPA